MRKWGVLYVGNRTGFWHWEIFMMIGNALTIFLIEFNPGYSQDVQVMAGLFSCSLIFSQALIKKPMAEKQLNNLLYLSIASPMLLMYNGLYFTSGW